MDTPNEATHETTMVMMLCPNLKCRKVLRVPEKCRGKQVRCQFCNLTFKVPEASPKSKDS
jgi:hypothetical protein